MARRTSLWPRRPVRCSIGRRVRPGSRESSANKETGRIDRTYRLGPGFSWQLTKHMGLSANLSNTIAGDAANTSHSRNTEFDASWTYPFAHGKEGLKKVAGQFFIRYANHYSQAIEKI